MSYKVRFTSHFEKQIKRIAKKHKAIVADLLILIEELEKNPATGVDLGGNFHKIRVSITGTNKGKSGGARVITFIVFLSETVYLTEVYLKNESYTADTTIISQRLKKEGII